VKEVEQIIDVLVARLSQKGVSPDEVPWLVRDVLNGVGGAGEPAVPTVNQRLSALGWEEEVLDEVTFAIIMYLAEKSEEGRVGGYRTSASF
jgi:predicted transcriptional regulator